MKRLILCDNGEPEKVLPLCEKYGFGIEMQGFCDANKTESKNELVERYKGILPETGERYLHAPFWDLCLGSNNKRIAGVTRFYFDYAYDIACELGCEGIIVHHGYVPNTSYPANWIRRSAAFWQDFFSLHHGDIKMLMENQCERETETIAGVVDACQNERLAVNLDIGHAHSNSGIAVADWIRRLNSRIQYVHLHQNNGAADEHLGLRDGNLPIVNVLNALNKYAPDAVWALECNTGSMESSVSFLRENGYEK